MATKTKTSETQTQAAAQSGADTVEKTFSEGLEHFNGGRLAEAAKAFELVKAEAASHDRLNLGRAARGYLTAVQARLLEQTAAKADAPELSIQMLLNRGDATGALEILAKAIAGQPERAVLHYLNALAYAILEQAEESADALAKAISLDPEVLFQFRLDADFDGVRSTAPNATLLRG